jgi:hypothetical protein
MCVISITDPIQETYLGQEELSLCLQLLSMDIESSYLISLLDVN